jgi:hypothetical protein
MTNENDQWEEDPIDYESLQKMVGKKYTFEDGDSLEIIQVKRRDNGPWVTFHVQQGPGIPRKLIMMLDEFQVTYGHLFEENPV